MNLDLWCLLLVGTFGFTGIFQGASGQVARVLAMAGATVIGYFAGAFAGAHLFPSWPASVRPALGGLLVGILAYVVIATVFRKVARRVVQANAWGKADRTLGGLLGALQGAYLAWILVMLLPLINQALATRGSHFRFHTEGSKAARFAAEHPLLVPPPNDKALKELQNIKKTADKFKSLDLPMGNGS
jgi:uncharacterized membrane protein required for colicin V production